MERVRRRLVGAALAALLAPRLTLAQARVYRVAWIGLNIMTPPWTPGSPVPFMGTGFLAYRARLAELGFADGGNLQLRVFMPKSPLGPDMEDAIREAVAWKADVIKVRTAIGTLAARMVAPTTPIVFSVISDPVASGVVSDLVHPGGNVTGVAPYHAEMCVKQLELVREMSPGARKVAVLFDSRSETGRLRVLDALQEAAPSMGLAIDEIDVAAFKGGMPAALERAAHDRAGAVLPVGVRYDDADNGEQKEAFQKRTRIPVVESFALDLVERGAVIATIYEDLEEYYRRAADVTARILRGANPGDIPVAGPMRVRLAINVRSAKAIGLAMPQSILTRADRIFQ